jgi:peptidoglycan/xylan/chitin deacetylase (PgdA/CDA1 family)
MSTPQVVSELQYSIDIIRQITGTVPKYVRPPFGDIGTVIPLDADFLL